jgi:uncharacterized membrane protein YkoI
LANHAGRVIAHRYPGQQSVSLDGAKGAMGKATLVLAALLAFAAGPSALAQPSSRYHVAGDFEGAVDQDGARQAVRRGNAAPFADILRKVRPQITGEIVGQKLEQHQGVWVYEFRVVAPDGHMQYLHFRARTGQPYQVRPVR